MGHGQQHPEGEVTGEGVQEQEGTGQLAPPGSVGLAEEPGFRVLRNPFCLVVLTTPRI